MSKTTNKFAPEVCARAVRMVLDHEGEDDIGIRIIQVLLGHALLTTTALYTRVATRTVKSVVSPLDRLGMFPASQAAPPG